MHLKIRDDNLLKQFWELETEPNNIFQKKLTNEEIKCENLFQSTTTRDNDGRYVVRLPFKIENPECEEGQFRELALKRFYSTEKRLLKNPKHYEEYQKVMKEYLTLNHMKLIESEQEIADPTAVYLSHHAVVREDKDTTKLRIVFDASQKGVNNVSLNDSLLIGPKLQQDLRHLLMRWRCGKIAIVADIVKMYRQVRVHDDDTKYQRILWRPDPNQPIQHYKLLTLTFGTACAPYLAVKCLQQIAKDEGYKYPMAAERVLKDFYVDDLMTTCKSEKESKLMYNEMNNLLHGSGFQLQKWSSNSENFLKYASEETTSSDQSIKIKANDTLKVLGITWNRTADDFEFEINLQNTNDEITKRRILSEIARLYDPMGWIAPVIVKAKIYIQRLWQANLDWDDTLPENLLTDWLNFRTDLVNLKNVKIPRWMKLTDNSHRELHAFADASKSAYAAVIYLRTVDIEGNVHVSLVTAKTKVAPIEKEVSIPRLELCGALLAAKLLYEVSQVLDISINNTFAWTDSTVVLAWLRAKSDIPNEIAQILSIEGTTWHFIPPHSPNFGGIWEAGVRSAKTHLKKVIGDSTLTFEELSTVLAQVEACLNSRPITQLSDSPDDPVPLTPGHFLVGEPLIAIPDQYNTDEKISGIERWRLMQKMVNDFWKRWSKEYLVTLSQRYKWTTERNEPEIDDIVIVKEDNIPPAKWVLGKIVEKHTGKDNITRVVTIKCKNNFLKRPVSKLCFLPKA
ncbi:uncharacterized protein LOC128199251 [Bicyclus anynana]|uniref:Uncharacterized protein LOC128199251 n=1 Tax=Bicyclus anynana TaxID=110368 RepID=A0ABM3LY26_BICAN|nr:uncharacterized protein LOC128199251 [Bicyclus anynana]